MMENVEVPEYFLCPISLQIMTDPVTVASGITYDRHSIEQWLFANHNTICPVTKHPLPHHPAPLTPNHTLRRLIHAWLTTLHSPSASPKTPLTKLYISNLIGGLGPPESQLPTLRQLQALALESERHRAYMAEADLATKLMRFVAACRRHAATDGIAEALSILYLIKGGSSPPKPWILKTEGRDSVEIIDSLMWVFGGDRFRGDEMVRAHAAHALRAAVEGAGPGVLERLRPGFFETAARGVREGGAWQGALLHVLLEVCPWGRNRAMMVEAGMVFEVVEAELRWAPAAEEKKRKKKKRTELVLGIIYELCGCAEGRAQLLGHAAGVAVVTRRMLQVSAAADERAVMIIWQIAKYSATKGVVQEMLRVGTVTNLCLVMLADSAAYLKEKARKILRMHFDAWKDSPCIEIATITRYTR